MKVWPRQLRTGGFLDSLGRRVPRHENLEVSIVDERVPVRLGPVGIGGHSLSDVHQVRVRLVVQEQFQDQTLRGDGRKVNGTVQPLAELREFGDLAERAVLVGRDQTFRGLWAGSNLQLKNIVDDTGPSLKERIIN